MQANDPAHAAEMYELADDLAPSAAALRNAARARLAAGHTATAATLAAQLLQRYSNDQESRRVAEAILADLAPKLAQLEITCNEDCTLTLDNRAASSSKPRSVHVLYTQPGARTIGASFSGGRNAQRQLTLRAGASTTMRLDAPPLPAPAAPASDPAPAPIVATPVVATPTHRESHGLQRKWLIITAVATAGLGAGAAWQGISTLSTRDDIKSATAAGDTARAASLYDRGRDEQLRTNILLGATAAFGVTSIVLAVMTDWSGGEERRDIAVTPTEGGATFAVGGRF